MTDKTAISDHAVLRYIERVHGVDIDAIREKMLTPALRAAIEAGARSIVIDGDKYIIKSGSVATVLSADMKDKPKPVQKSRKHVEGFKGNQYRGKNISTRRPTKDDKNWKTNWQNSTL